MFQPRVILHPTNLSESSRLAYSVGVDLARQYGAKLLVLHVAETLGPENVTYGEAVSQLEPNSYQQRLEDDLRRTLPPAPGVAIEYLLVEGDPVAEINRVAQEHECDLMVITTHGRTGLARLLMGSTAEKLVRLAPCPLLIVKFPLTTTATKETV